MLNRLGLDSLILIGERKHGDFAQLEQDDVDFFRKLPNFDTLRLILADQVILVEGISDLLVVEEAIRREYDRSAEDLGVDIISMEGTKHKRWLELAKLLNKPVIAIRDRDGKEDGYWHEAYKESLGENGQLFVGLSDGGKTLEPQIAHANEANMESLLAELGIEKEKGFTEWATENKSEAALQLIQLDQDLWRIPEYIVDAARALKFGGQ